MITLGGIHVTNRLNTLVQKNHFYVHCADILPLTTPQKHIKVFVTGTLGRKCAEIILYLYDC